LIFGDFLLFSDLVLIAVNC